MDSDAAPSDDEQALEEQQALAESCLPLLAETWQDAIDEGVDDPVVVLVDCEDPYGGQMARAWLGDEAVSEAIAQVRATDEEGATTVFARAVSWRACRDEILSVFPYLEPAFAGAPSSEGFLVVSVTSCGACALLVPLDALSSDDHVD